MTRDLMLAPVAVLSTVVLLWFSYPGTVEAWPLIFVAFVPLLYVAACASPAKRFLLGLLCGTVHFIIVLYWIVNVLGHYGGLPWFLAVPALVLLSLYMGGYFALFTAVAGHYLKTRGVISLLLVPALWVGLDWLRSFLFSGFPWMDPGYALWQQPAVIQTADLFGHHAVTYIILLVNCFLLFILQEKSARAKMKYIAVVVVLFTAAGTYSAIRWQRVSLLVDNAKTARVGIVQGNIDQSEKWSPEAQTSTIEKYSFLTQKLFISGEPPELVVWPETALPFFPSRNPLFDNVLGLAGEHEAYVLTGSPWFEFIDYEKNEVEFYNGAIAISPAGSIDGKYFKNHLVPFGEYVPLQDFLFFLEPLVEAVGDFTRGKIENPLPAGQISAGVLICFESIFPEIARKWAAADANLLVNLTNDAWYGKSSAPHQSMAMSVFRAVETRRSLVRSANTGISGFVDPLGRVVMASDIFVPWNGKRDVVLMTNTTVFTGYGYLFAPLCFMVSVAMVGRILVKRKKG